MNVQEEAWKLTPNEVAHLVSAAAQARLGKRTARQLEDQARQLESQAQELRRQAEEESSAWQAGWEGLVQVLAHNRGLERERVVAVGRRDGGHVFALVKATEAEQAEALAPSDPPATPPGSEEPPA